MKKILLSLTLSFLATIHLQAQYHPMLESVNVWSIVSNLVPVAPHPAGQPCSYPFPVWNPLGQLATCGDTVLHTHDYKKLCLDGGCTFGYLREDTAARRVYFQDVVDSPEVLLYDFAMVVGDTIEINFPYAWSNYFPNGTYRLDSITTVNIRAGTRNAFHLNCTTTSSPHTLTWIESVGNLANVIYPYTLNDYGANQFPCNDFPHDFIHFTSCFEHTDKVYFDSCAYAYALTVFCFTVLDSCNYYNSCGSINEHDESTLLQVYPNPVANKFTIQKSQVANGATFDISIYNVLGKKVMAFEQQAGNRQPENSFDVSQLSSGIFYLEINTDKKIFHSKFIKQ